jgi:site-specific DNA-methyltransferase (adenine-specific)
VTRRAARSQTKLFQGNLLIYGDNLKVMRNPALFREESIDLVYLDPPFKPTEKYNVLFRPRTDIGGAAQVRAFEDAWGWGEAARAAYHDSMENAPTKVRHTLDALDSLLGKSDMFAYVCMMAPRLVELHRVLRDTGAIYLHCDSAASHYLRILMDATFGPENFKNEIIWKRTSAHSNPRRWGPVHDVLLYYSKGQGHTWNPLTQDYGAKYLATKYRHEDERGKYRLSDLTGSGLRGGSSGQPWRGFDPSDAGRHWGVPRAVLESLVEKPEEIKAMSTQEKLDLLDQNGYVYWTPRDRKGTAEGFPQLKRYLRGGVPIQDVITDIAPVNSMAAEREGYPTQKPVELLQRIIQSSSREGEVVLDPFCGCGSTVAAAQSLGRKWVGIDVAYDAVRIIRARLAKAGLVEKLDFEVWGEPESVSDAMQLAKDDKYQFQWWAVRRLGAREIDYKKGPDSGIDGRLILRAERSGNRLPEAIISVKAGATSVAHVRDLRGVVEREKAEIGVLVTRKEPTDKMKAEASDAGDYTDGNKWYPRIQLLTAEDIINGKGVAYPVTMLEEKKTIKKPTATKRKRTTKRTI